MKGIISDIKRFAVHDGDGIRTTVFLKGCSLNCVWCHNPEGISFKPQLAYYDNTCVHCGKCVAACPSGAHRLLNRLHLFDRNACIDCGTCASDCLSGALRFYGTSITTEELLPLLLEDKEFYDVSGGGVTISGGECLCQSEFCAKLLKALQEQGIHTAVDTCGMVSKAALDQVLPYTDCFLYDIKAFDEEVHVKCTGHSNHRILENLQYLDACGANIEVRIPYVPNYNDGQMQKIAEFLKPLKHIKRVKVLPYHNYAGSKYRALGLPDTLPPQLPTEEELHQIEALFGHSE